MNFSSHSFLFAIIGVMLMAPSPALKAQSDGEPVLIGPLTVESLIDIKGWFEADFVRYVPDLQYIDPMKKELKDLQIVCVLGTWCGDSKREVPRFLKIMQLLGLDPQQVRFIGVDRNKQTPDGSTLQFGIEKVPTFVFLKDGKELGRIVEQPIGVLEKDMMGILVPPVPPPPPSAIPTPDQQGITPTVTDDAKQKEADSQRQENQKKLEIK